MNTKICYDKGRNRRKEQMLQIHFWSSFAVFPLICLERCFCYYSMEHASNTVNCSYNNMTQLPESLLPRTEHFIFHGHDLHVINFINPNLPAVKVLDLQSNKIQSITDEAFRMLLTKTNKLMLCDNRLKYLPSFLQNHSSNTTLFISRNPFECNCDMMWMRDWLLNATNVKDKENVICAAGKWKGEKCIVWSLL